MEWISVEDRLPEESDWFLVSWFCDDNPQVDKSFWYRGEWRFYGWNLEPDVTHWMPLPEPPEKA